jgi:hypothetical protein
MKVSNVCTHSLIDYFFSNKKTVNESLKNKIQELEKELTEIKRVAESLAESQQESILFESPFNLKIVSTTCVCYCKGYLTSITGEIGSGV